MAKFKDLTGMVFERLVVIGNPVSVPVAGRNRYYWDCQCQCGNTISVRTDCLTSGFIRSCGCLHKESAAEQGRKKATHKMSGTKPYQKWQGMKSRCYDITDKSYYRYGGRGITVCDEWKNSFECFYSWLLQEGYISNAPYGQLTIDRVDNNGPYNPQNCRLTDMKTQSRNRRSNINIFYDGKIRTLKEVSELTGFIYGTLHARYKRGDRGDHLLRPLKHE